MEAGVDLDTLRELLGHATLEMFLRYAHLSLDHKKKAVNLVTLESAREDNPSLGSEKAL